MSGYHVAIVGATGLVGRTILQVLQERDFPIKKLTLLASSRSAGSTVEFKGESYSVQEATPASFKGVDFAFFSAGGGVSEKLAPAAAQSGAVVIDNSSAFRLDPEVPLVVPEVNPEDAKKHKGIIANPNCSTIQMVVALNPLHQAAGLKRVVVSTYQAVSGAGHRAIQGLENESRAVLEGREPEKNTIPHRGAARYHQIAFNVVPQIDVFDEDDYCKEEMKMIKETRKIMNLPELAITATTVRVPVSFGHSESVNVELNNPLPPSKAKEILKKSAGIVVVDNPSQLEYPMPVMSKGKDEVFVGRIRVDRSVPYGLNLWVVADNIRKGAATNSVQIAELLA